MQLSVQNKARLLTVVITVLGAFVGTVKAATPVTSDVVTADGNKVLADVQSIAADEQQIQTVVIPARKALKDAKDKYETDAAPYRTQLTALEDQWNQSLKSDKAAIDAARVSNEPIVAAAEQKHRANVARKDKASISQSETELKAARQKLEDEVKSAEAKHKADVDQRDQAVTAAKTAMETALKPGADALQVAQQAMNVANVWNTKLDADRAALKADKLKLQADKDALSQQQ